MCMIIDGTQEKIAVETGNDIVLSGGTAGAIHLGNKVDAGQMVLVTKARKMGTATLAHIDREAHGVFVPKVDAVTRCEVLVEIAPRADASTRGLERRPETLATGSSSLPPETPQ